MRVIITLLITVVLSVSAVKAEEGAQDSAAANEQRTVGISFKTAKTVSDRCPVTPGMTKNPPMCFISEDPVAVTDLTRVKSLEHLMSTNDVNAETIIPPNTFFYLGN